MIGIYAILMYAGFFALPLFLLTGAVWSLVDARRRKPTNTFHKNEVDHARGSLAIMMLAIVFLGSLTIRTLREVGFHSELSRVRPETVDRIEIGGKAVTDRKQIAEIVRVLNQWEWYSLRHGDAADEIPFVIKLTSGQQFEYQARRYLLGEGAALASHSASGWSNGEVFYRMLPASLAQAGVTLPPCSTYFGKPQHCALQ